jgi:ArsR family transcriptional regulator
VCELEAALKVPQSKVSRHLSILKSAGLVVDRREGIWIFYSLFKPQTAFEKSIVKLIQEVFKDSPAVTEDNQRLKKKLSQIYAYKCKINSK